MNVTKGDRVELIHTNDKHTKLTPGVQGTVSFVRDDPWGQVISVNWDDGSRLSMLPDEGDRIRKL